MREVAVLWGIFFFRIREGAAVFGIGCMQGMRVRVPDGVSLARLVPTEVAPPEPGADASDTDG